MLIMPAGKLVAGLSREQKTGFVLLSVFAILAVSLGILQIRNTMYKPFALSNKVPPLANSIVNDINTLRYRDTDKDSLNDFDELYVYGTSPYLADTDSDGAKDNDEIKKGTSPLCSASTNMCVGASSGTAIASNSTNTMFGTITAPTNTPVDLEKALQDPKKVREMLIAAGMDKTLLDKISDTDLMATVAKTMSVTGDISGATTTSMGTKK